jgi:LAO/AO transport system kinase
VHEASGELNVRRAVQARDWMWSEVSDSLLSVLQSNPVVCEQIPLLEAAASEGQIPPTVAARQLLELFLKGQK